VLRATCYVLCARAGVRACRTGT